MKWIYLKQIFLVGIPAGTQSTVINFFNVLLQSSVNSFGSVAMAGYTAANNIFGFLYAAVNSVTQACMSFTSQNFGTGKWKRMDRVLLDCVVLSVGISLILGGGAYLFGPELLQIYTSDPEVIQCGMEIFPGALRGIGYSAVPMILSVIGTVGTRIVWIITILLQAICFWFVRKKIYASVNRG